MPSAQVLSAIFTGVSALIAVTGLVWAAHVYRRQTNAQILIECTRRYDDIVAAFPPDAWAARLDPVNPPQVTPETTQAVSRYLNLWELQFYLWRQHYFSEEIFGVWGKLLASTLKGALLRREWLTVQQDFVVDEDFTKLVNDLQSQKGTWTGRRLTLRELYKSEKHVGGVRLE